MLQVHVRYGDLKDEFLQNLTSAVKDFRKSHTEKEESGANSNNSYPRHPIILLEYEGKKIPKSINPRIRFHQLNLWANHQKNPNNSRHFFWGIPFPY